MSKYFNVCVAHNKIINGVEKTSYHKVGVLKVSDNGGYFLKLYQQPNTTFRIFDNQEDELPTID